MSWIDALYFSTETMATVGYGDFNFLNQPLWLRLWGVVMMLGGVATTAIVVAFVADVLLSRRLSQADQPPADPPPAPPFRGRRSRLLRHPGGRHAQGRPDYASR